MLLSRLFSFSLCSAAPPSVLGTYWCATADTPRSTTTGGQAVLRPNRIDIQDMADFVVVGGGNAGLTVASRLSENPLVTVTVLEAGFNAEHLPEVYIPGLIGTGQSFSTLNWAYKTTPQAELNGRVTTVNAGKVLGGGTVINSMIFPRALKSQYDAWSALNNDDANWTWEGLLPYFKKSERFTPPNPTQAENGARYIPEYHGDSDEGRIQVGFPNYFYPQSTLWRMASAFKESPDLGNGDVQAFVGVSPNTLDANNNTRCSATCAYYTPFSGRPNLRVITNVTVNRIRWLPKPRQSIDLHADRVEFITADGEKREILVGKEVILAAGAIGSPKVLELSGIGNRTILEQAGVSVVLDFPTIGENLADHVHGWANAYTNASYTRDSLRLDPTFANEQRHLWETNQTGLLSAAPRSLGIASPYDLFSSDDLRHAIKEARENLGTYASAFANGNDDLAKGITTQHRLMLDALEAGSGGPVELNLEPGYAGPTPANERPKRKYTSINAVLFSPFSRGRTHIVKSDVLIPPAVNPAYYTHHLDILTHVRAIQLGRKMLATPPLVGIYEGEYEPGPSVVGDASLEEWARKTVSSDNHVVGSLAMMPRPMGGVVDTKLKVYGTGNVRVVDASIIPMPISAHLMSTVYAIAERAADFIRQDYRL